MCFIKYLLESDLLATLNVAHPVLDWLSFAVPAYHVFAASTSVRSWVAAKTNRPLFGRSMLCQKAEPMRQKSLIHPARSVVLILKNQRLICYWGGVFAGQRKCHSMENKRVTLTVKEQKRLNVMVGLEARRVAGLEAAEFDWGYRAPQPAYRFSGHTEQGYGFLVYVQAVENAYLSPEF